MELASIRVRCTIARWSTKAVTIGAPTTSGEGGGGEEGAGSPGTAVTSPGRGAGPLAWPPRC